MINRNHNFLKLQASGLQFIINQFTTILLFFITSKYLSKDLFANFNWLTALYITIGSLMSYGIEQLIIKSIAEDKSIKTTRIYFFHLLAVSILLMLGIGSYYALTGTSDLNYVLFGVWALATLFNVALKNSLIGFELFKKLVKLSIISSSVKLAGILLFIFLPIKSIQSVLLILISSLFLESLFAFRLIKKETDWDTVNWSLKTDYPRLLKMAYPQLVVVIFGVALARFDWIYIGAVESAETTADYTFAYKIFEFAKLPILVISPILLPLFSRIFSNPQDSPEHYKSNLDQLYSAELFIAGLLPILFASFWTPLLSFIFDNKYGDSNYIIFCILAMAIPMQYTTDYYWNLTFSQSKYKLNMWVSVLTTISNITLVIVLTPYISSTGTAIAYTASYLVAFALYYITQSGSEYRIHLYKIAIVYALILISLLIIYLVKHNLYITFFIPLAYSFLLIKFKFINMKKLKAIFFK